VEKFKPLVCGWEVAPGNEKAEAPVVDGAAVFAPNPKPPPRPESVPPKPGVCDAPEEAVAPPNGFAAGAGDVPAPNRGLKAGAPEAGVALEAGWLEPPKLLNNDMVSKWRRICGVKWYACKTNRS